MICINGFETSYDAMCFNYVILEGMPSREYSKVASKAILKEKENIKKMLLNIGKQKKKNKTQKQTKFTQFCQEL